VVAAAGAGEVGTSALGWLAEALLAAVMTAYILAAVKYLEEPELEKTFGDAYQRYQREVPMLFPVQMRRR
jgi:protein-S-isoprenylcysteine O-methyltransferase Ste14